MIGLEPAQDRPRVGQHLAVVELEDRDEVLAAQRPDGRAVVRVDVDPLDRQALVAEGERDALDVRRVGDAEDAHRGVRVR